MKDIAQRPEGGRCCRRKREVLVRTGEKWWLWPDAGFDRQGHTLVQGSQKMLDANFGRF